MQNFAAGSVNALTSVVATIGNVDAVLQTQGSSPFVVSTPSQVPDQQSGGVWARGFGGSFRDSAPTGGFKADSASVASVASPTGGVGCQSSSVRQGFAGAQAGADIADLNLGGNGGTLHLGLTSGFLEATSNSSDGVSSVDFQVPFFGAYATATYGDFFADTELRGNFFQGSYTQAGSTISGQRFNAQGFTISGNVGYHVNLPENWFLEPSLGVNWSRTYVDPMNLSTPTIVTASTGPLSATSVSQLRVYDFDSVLGRASLRAGTTLVEGQYIFQPYFTASVFHEFADPIASTINTTTLTNSVGNFFESSALTTGRTGTYGQFGLGAAGQIANSGWTSCVRGDYITGSRFEGWDVVGGLRYDFNPETAVVQGRSADVRPIPALPPLYNWTGFYVGVSAPGALWGETNWSPAGIAGSAASNYSGLLIGGGGGYNYQIGPYVVGGAVEWDWTNARGGESFTTLNPFEPSVTNLNTRINSIFTATARVGYAIDRVLVYGQGGLALGDNFGAKIVFDSIPGTPSVSSSQTTVGWAAGAGFEFGLTQNISAKAEYLYFDLGSNTYNLGGALFAINRSGNIGRVGLNYRFD